MFEFLKKIVSPARRIFDLRRADSMDHRSGDVVFWVDMPPIAATTSASTGPAPPAMAHAGRSVTAESATDRRSRKRRPGSHRERLLAMRLDHLKICPPRRCQQLGAVGVQTAGDLVFGDPAKIAATLPNSPRAERVLRRYRAAIRMAAAIDSMMPRDALLLVSIHRRSVASLSRESAAQLHRDLERFSLSSRGSKLVGRRGVPSLRRVKTWIATCHRIAESATASPMAQAPA